MKNIFLVLFLFINVSLFAQTDSINNKLSGNHIKVNGTKVSLVPPKGCSSATSFAGFIKADEAVSVMVTELPGPFKEVSAGFNQKDMATRGMELVAKKELVIQNKKGFLIDAKQKNPQGTIFLKKVLIFGDAKSTAILNASVPEVLADKYIKELEASLLSVVINDEETIGENSASFKVDVSGTKFKFGVFAANSLIYSVDGNVPPKVADQSSFIVSQSLVSEGIAKSKGFAEERLKKMPDIGTIQIKETNEISVNGLSGYEVIGEAKKNGATAAVYEVILYHGSGYYIMVGHDSKNSKDAVEVFRKIASTFEKK